MSPFQTAHATKQDGEAAKKKVSSIEEEKKRYRLPLEEPEGLKNVTRQDMSKIGRRFDKAEGRVGPNFPPRSETKNRRIAGYRGSGAGERDGKKQYADMKLRIKYM